MSISRILSAHKRGVQELHKVTPQLFPVITLTAVLSALIPYVTVFFSAQILKELALLRRADVLWKWVISGVVTTGTLAIANAFLHQRYASLFDDVWGRKEILFCRKAFSFSFNSCTMRACSSRVCSPSSNISPKISTGWLRFIR